MKLGYFDFNPDYSIRPDDLAHACEERGYDSLWLGEHINIPLSRRTPYPLGGELPKYYSHMRDPFISRMAAGAVTKNLKLATSICLMIERDPITTAKEVFYQIAPHGVLAYAETSFPGGAKRWEFQKATRAAQPTGINSRA
jgi:hypothetical protein